MLLLRPLAALLVTLPLPAVASVYLDAVSFTWGPTPVGSPLTYDFSLGLSNQPANPAGGSVQDVAFFDLSGAQNRTLALSFGTASAPFFFGRGAADALISAATFDFGGNIGNNTGASATTTELPEAGSLFLTFHYAPPGGAAQAGWVELLRQGGVLALGRSALADGGETLRIGDVAYGIPEPGTSALLAGTLALGAMVWHRRRRRQRLTP